MKKILIIWGGWDGHTPEVIAKKLEELLLKEKFSVISTCNFSVLLNQDLTQYDVIIPIWSCGINGDIYLNQLLEAIKSGVGLATFHGGIKWFEDERYYEMIGGSYLNDSSVESYEVKFTDSINIITAGIEDFNISSEKYFMQVDPRNHILATANFSEVSTPVAWTKYYGEGRIFYCTLAHSEDQLFTPSSSELLMNGIKWCAVER